MSLEKFEEYLVPGSDACETMIEKKSRFIGHIWPVETEQEAIDHIKQMREKHWDASHNVYAYIIKDGPTRYSDDGEPGGTAGMPVLNVLLQERVYNVCCVVTRYFGGTLLGAGGLVRTYSRTAKIALDAAGICTKRLWDVLTIPCPYGLYERVQQELANHDGVTEDTQFAAEVTIRALLPADRTERFLLRLTDLSSGRLQAERTEQVFRACG